MAARKYFAKMFCRRWRLGLHFAKMFCRRWRPKSTSQKCFAVDGGQVCISQKCFVVDDGRKVPPEGFGGHGVQRKRRPSSGKPPHACRKTLPTRWEAVAEIAKPCRRDGKPLQRLQTRADAAGSRCRGCKRVPPRRGPLQRLQRRADAARRGEKVRRKAVSGSGAAGSRAGRGACRSRSSVR